MMVELIPITHRVVRNVGGWPERFRGDVRVRLGRRPTEGYLIAG